MMRKMINDSSFDCVCLEVEYEKWAGTWQWGEIALARSPSLNPPELHPSRRVRLAGQPIKGPNSRCILDLSM